MTDWETFRAELRARKRRRWARILASEPAGPAPGRGPRDPVKESLLLALDRARLRRAGRG